MQFGVKVFGIARINVQSDIVSRSNSDASSFLMETCAACPTIYFSTFKTV